MKIEERCFFPLEPPKNLATNKFQVSQSLPLPVYIYSCYFKKMNEIWWFFVSIVPSLEVFQPNPIFLWFVLLLFFFSIPPPLKCIIKPIKYLHKDIVKIKTKQNKKNYLLQSPSPLFVILQLIFYNYLYFNPKYCLSLTTLQYNDHR